MRENKYQKRNKRKFTYPVNKLCKEPFEKRDQEQLIQNMMKKNIANQTSSHEYKIYKWYL